MCTLHISFLFFFNNTATTEIYTLSLHDALPICSNFKSIAELQGEEYVVLHAKLMHVYNAPTRSGKKMTKATASDGSGFIDRKSTRLNSSHANISYAVFCLKKKKKKLKSTDQLKY